MSVEYADGMPEVGRTPDSLTEFQTPAQLIARSHDARRTFADFMWRYVGDPSPQMQAWGHFPLLGREAVDGTPLHFTEVQYSGYSNLSSSLVHVRLDPAQVEPNKRFFVVTGSLRTTELQERYVTAAEHNFSVRDGLQTTLYLDDVACQAYPQEYWPQVVMSQQGFHYYPGGDHLAEQLRGIAGLHGAALGRLALVQE